MLAAAPGLEFLDVTRCPELTDATLARVAALGGLRELVCYADAGLGAYGLLGRCPRLRRLDCTGSRTLGGAAVAAVAAAAGPRLEELVLSWCPAVDDAGAVALGRHCAGPRGSALYAS